MKLLTKGENMKPNHLRVFMAALITGLFLLTGCTATQTAKVQQEKPDYFFHDLVDAAFVKAHLSVPMSKDIMLVDSRPYKGKYVNGHIPGAVSLPWSEFDKKKDMLPAEKSTLLIFYCEGPT